MWVQSLMGEVGAGPGEGRGPLLEDGPRGMGAENSTHSISYGSSQRLAQYLRVSLGSGEASEPMHPSNYCYPSSPPKDPPVDWAGSPLVKPAVVLLLTSGLSNGLLLLPEILPRPSALLAPPKVGVCLWLTSFYLGSRLNAFAR